MTPITFTPNEGVKLDHNSLFNQAMHPDGGFAAAGDRPNR